VDVGRHVVAERVVHLLVLLDERQAIEDGETTVAARWSSSCSSRAWETVASQSSRDSIR